MWLKDLRLSQRSASPSSAAAEVEQLSGSIAPPVSAQERRFGVEVRHEPLPAILGSEAGLLDAAEGCVGLQCPGVHADIAGPGERRDPEIAVTI